MWKYSFPPFLRSSFFHPSLPSSLFEYPFIQPICHSFLSEPLVSEPFSQIWGICTQSGWVSRCPSPMLALRGGCCWLACPCSPAPEQPRKSWVRRVCRSFFAYVAQRLILCGFRLSLQSLCAQHLRGLLQEDPATLAALFLRWWALPFHAASTATCSPRPQAGWGAAFSVGSGRSRKTAMLLITYLRLVLRVNQREGDIPEMCPPRLPGASRGHEGWWWPVSSESWQNICPSRFFTAKYEVKPACLMVPVNLTCYPAPV